ncbi:hypothetical protein BCV70DRAFT_105194 [Testicularia cyperi]|uniref:Uncharacterized protein n=1 Tax=Testicularia cyperi TaxID=1882483 RepID=A0A317XPD8_9BASI|nr:hypothetical protein BCV70DRAFT_105194 [Testicularia cyperi]
MRYILSVFVILLCTLPSVVSNERIRRAPVGGWSGDDGTDATPRLRSSSSSSRGRDQAVGTIQRPPSSSIDRFVPLPTIYRPPGEPGMPIPGSQAIPAQIPHSFGSTNDDLFLQHDVELLDRMPFRRKEYTRLSILPTDVTRYDFTLPDYYRLPSDYSENKKSYLHTVGQEKGFRIMLREEHLKLDGSHAPRYLEPAIPDLFFFLHLPAQQRDEQLTNQALLTADAAIQPNSFGRVAARPWMFNGQQLKALNTVLTRLRYVSKYKSYMEYPEPIEAKAFRSRLGRILGENEAAAKNGEPVEKFSNIVVKALTEVMDEHRPASIFSLFYPTRWDWDEQFPFLEQSHFLRHRNINVAEYLVRSF